MSLLLPAVECACDVSRGYHGYAVYKVCSKSWPVAYNLGEVQHGPMKFDKPSLPYHQPDPFLDFYKVHCDEVLPKLLPLAFLG